MSDALASAGVIVAGVLILRYELYIADLTITVVIGDFVIWQGVTLLPRTVRLLMGAVPDESEFDRIVSDLRDAEGVADVHHVHIWSISEHYRALEAHVVPAESSLQAFEDVKARARGMLETQHAIAHATFEACLAADCDPDMIPDHQVEKNHHHDHDRDH